MESVNQILKEKIILKGAQDPSEPQTKMMINQCKQSPCLLCGGAPAFVGLFSPLDSWEFGAASGKARQFFYSLCKDCITADNWEELVAEVLKSKSKDIKWK